MSLNDDLVILLKSSTKIELQNVLLSTSDREIALSVMYMKDQDRNFLLASVSEKKAKRIIDELKLINRVNIKYDLYCISIKRVINSLKNIKNKDSLKSYLRPKNTRFR